MTEPPLTMSSPTSPVGTSTNSSLTALTSIRARRYRRCGLLPFGRVDGDDGRAFAQAVAFKSGTRELRFKVEDGLFRQRRTAADKQTDAVEPSEIPRDFRFAHGGVNRGHAQNTVARLNKTCFKTLENGKTDFTKIIEHAI